MSDLIDLLQRQQLVWHGNEQLSNVERVSTGIKTFDKYLQGGLPKHGVIDIQAPHGIGEIRVLLPYLKQQERLTVFINPPGYVNGHGLFHLGFDTTRLLVVHPDNDIDALWSAEQCLKSGACSSVILWQDRLAIHQIKRLQLAAEQGGALQFIMRNNTSSHLSLPVSLCLKFAAHNKGLEVSINKQKGGWSKSRFVLMLESYWPELYQPPKADKVISLSEHRKWVSP
ncbi:recombinase RecA [Pseudoalteromonas citrea]|uniref:Recombinase RecA n=1 Tax=Pseudoalteromonas citrea TaxID=43655 RepID=A0A5S3XL96_9GAMM|nr:translesion DNA synthesis-associated protein ImuA [Pseudoalteromonas citrea]TMP38793.1 recombinase RecA [Pseudoalteromonas citrea]TMP54340.1 recombinase RecA [Pseudoalteromonas citrea]